MPRTLNDIIPPSRRRQLESEGAPVTEETPFVPAPPPIMKPPRPVTPPRRFPYGTAIVVLVIIAAVAGGLYLFSGAKIEITPAQNTGAVNATLTATPNTGDLPYQIVTATAEQTKSVPAESTSTVQQAAQGTITVYNTQPKAQQLITNTRFETQSGLVYRIHTGITVPAGTAAVPGSVTATVYADSAGEQYNVGPTSFNVPGLSGSPAYTQVYAKSTTPLTGGFSGVRPTIASSTASAAQTALQSALASDLATAVAAKIPNGYILVPGANFTTFTPEPSDSNAPGIVNVHEQGSITAVVFPADAFAKTVAFQLGVSAYTGQVVTLTNASTLNVKPVQNTPPAAGSAFQFTLTGNANIVWNIDTAKIAAAVAGKTRAQATSILNGFPEVSEAFLVLRPFWVDTLPSDPAKITIVVQKAAAN